MKLLYILLIISIAGCQKTDDENRSPTRNKSTQIIGEFKTKQYQINQDEHITVFDVPDYFQPTRCWVFVNEKTNTSHMRCDDQPGTAMPDYQGSTDR